MPALADVGVLVRPHPYNASHWRDTDLMKILGVEVYPGRQTRSTKRIARTIRLAVP